MNNTFKLYRRLCALRAPNIMENSAYSVFAGVYDSLTDSVEYKKRFEYIQKLFKKYNSAPQLVLDLACGTGSITSLMAAAGYDMIGIDASCDMLNIAKSKPYSENIMYLNMNMDDFELYGTVDAVLCLLDSLNYLTFDDEIQTAFHLIYNYLNPGGLFIFDMNTPYRLRELLPSNAYCGEAENAYYTWETVFDREEKIAEFTLEFFIKHANLYKRVTEHHYQRAYTQTEIKRFLKKAGLNLLAVFDDMSFSTPRSKSSKIFYVAAKEN